MLKCMVSAEKNEIYAPAHNEMFKYARERLMRRSPQETALAAGVEFNDAQSQFHFESMGQKILINYLSCEAVFAETGETPSWIWHLIMLHYLDMADGAPLSRELITFREVEGGLIRGTGFENDSSRIIAKTFGSKPAQNIKKACEALGASLIESNADICAVFPYLPRYSVILKIWLEDEEMEGSGQMLLNSRASHYLSGEDAVTAGSMILEFLTCRYEQIFSEMN